MNGVKKLKANVLGCFIDLVDMPQALKRTEDIIDKSRPPAHVITLNAEIAYQAHYDLALRETINSADLVTADGIGIVWAVRQQSLPMNERVTGIDLLTQLCSLAEKRNWKVYFLGAAPGVAQKAAENLLRQYPALQVSGSHDGYFKEEDIDSIIEDIKEKSPEILFVALGVPKQEYWISQHKEKLQIPLSVGVGGSFDVIAGIKKRAPHFMIRLNLEWLYRLLSEPGRIRRQLVLPKFVLLVIIQKYFSKQTNL